MTAAPVRYTPDVEEVKPDECETIQKLNEAFDEILETVAEDYGHAVRSVHAKGHGLLEATLTVDGDLPPELAQGLFAQGGEHKAYVRMSTNAGDILDDAISLPRGMAIKVLDVEGERLPGAQGATQDFVLVNGPVFLVPTADKFLANLKLLAKTTDKAETSKVALSAVLRTFNKALTAIGIESPKLQNLGGAPQSEPLGETFYSVTPFRYGDYIAKFSVKPVTPEQQALTGQEIDVGDDYDAIRHTVQDEMRGMDVAWEFGVQLARDLEKQPIEDPTQEWDEKEFPFQRVGILRAKAQDSWSGENVRKIDEQMRFSIWTGLAAHRPLGNINRARKETYEHSAAFRERVNGCPIHEPVAA